MIHLLKVFADWGLQVSDGGIQIGVKALLGTVIAASGAVWLFATELMDRDEQAAATASDVRIISRDVSDLQREVNDLSQRQDTLAQRITQNHRSVMSVLLEIKNGEGGATYDFPASE